MKKPPSAATTGGAVRTASCASRAGIRASTHCRAHVDRGAQRAPNLFDDADRARGGIDSEDRHGHRRFFPITTVAVGVACFDAAFPKDAETVASLAASAKRLAKTAGLGMHMVRWEPDNPVAA